MNKLLLASALIIPAFTFAASDVPLSLSATAPDVELKTCALSVTGKLTQESCEKEIKDVIVEEKEEQSKEIIIDKKQESIRHYDLKKQSKEIIIRKKKEEDVSPPVKKSIQKKQYPAKKIHGKYKIAEKKTIKSAPMRVKFSNKSSYASSSALKTTDWRNSFNADWKNTKNKKSLSSRSKVSTPKWQTRTSRSFSPMEPKVITEKYVPKNKDAITTEAKKEVKKSRSIRHNYQKKQSKKIIIRKNPEKEVKKKYSGKHKIIDTASMRMNFTDAPLYNSSTTLINKNSISPYSKISKRSIPMKRKVITSKNEDIIAATTKTEKLRKPIQSKRHLAAKKSRKIISTNPRERKMQILPAYKTYKAKTASSNEKLSNNRRTNTGRNYLTQKQVLQKTRLHKNINTSSATSESTLNRYKSARSLNRFNNTKKQNILIKRKPRTTTNSKYTQRQLPPIEYENVVVEEEVITK